MAAFCCHCAGAVASIVFRQKFRWDSEALARDLEVVVAGGGIAGLTAALECARLGRRTLALTGDVLGGHLLSIEKVEGYPGFPEGVAGYDLCPMAQEQATAAGAEFAASELTGLEPKDGGWLVKTRDGEHAARAVVLATGSSLKELGVPGEERLRGRGVSHCASCDAPLMRGRTVVVVGGGDSAMQEALTLAAAAQRVIMLVRGQALAGQASFRDRVSKTDNIEIRYGRVAEEILGANTVTGVRTRAAGNGAAEDLEASGVFVYVGMRPNTAYLGGRLELDPEGRIPTDGGMRTKLPGIFAAGYVRSGSPGRAVASAGEGTAAALAADRYLSYGS
jgi:thioredoxin reductase (NADPH)